MEIHHLRNATFVIESGDLHLLIDPMLGARGTLPAFARFRHAPRRNPTVDLPDEANAVLEKVTHCLITHCRTFGVRALQHTDHLDPAGERFLLARRTPVICSRKAPGKVVANHLEALNHCPTQRSDLKRELVARGLDAKVIVPDDGATFEIRQQTPSQGMTP